MNTKLLTVILLMTSIAVVVATTITITTEANSASAKFCDPSGCKGDQGYYTKEGHHHCFEGTKGCEESNYKK